MSLSIRLDLDHDVISIVLAIYLEYARAFKGYLCYKTIFCHKVALGAQLKNFFI